ncbi:MAG TPA: hypothetical protein VI251_17700 [Pseudolabrys sp.]|jgi:hypothetical protein
MHGLRLFTAFAAVLIAGATAPALAQQKQTPSATAKQPPAQQQPVQQAPQVAPPKPYKPVAVTPPKPMTDAGLEDLRKRIGAAAEKKDRAALGSLVVTKGFFWERENGDGADKTKPGVDSLASALGLANKDGAGWDMLAGYAEEPTAAPSQPHKGAVCAPADPTFDNAAFDALLKATETDVGEWGYPVSANIEVHGTAQANAPVTDKLGLAFVRVMPEATTNAPSYLRIVTPAGKIGFVSIDSVAPIGNDQICYVKDGGAWKIGGYIGGGDGQ